VRAGAASLFRRPEDGITASTNGQGLPNSAQRFNSRRNSGRVKTPMGM